MRPVRRSQGLRACSLEACKTVTPDNHGMRSSVSDAVQQRCGRSKCVVHTHALATIGLRKCMQVSACAWHNSGPVGAHQLPRPSNKPSQGTEVPVCAAHGAADVSQVARCA